MNDIFYNDLEMIKHDESQYRAYLSNENTVVIAGPGSGKTRILTLKFMKLVSTEVSDTTGIACLSYSKETVRELKKRLKEYGYKKRTQDFIGTLHGFCLAEIIGPFQRIYPEYEIPFPLKIASTVLRRQIYLGVLKELNKKDSELSELLIEKERYHSILGSSLVNIVPDYLARKAAEIYEYRLKKSDHFDFVQMAKISTKMIQEKEYVARTIEAKYPWLLIDEYQDLGKALHEIVLSLRALTTVNIYAVGDMDQSIYGFAGAYPDYLEELYNNDNFISMTLKYNYRSNQDIIKASLTTLNRLPPEPEYQAMLRANEKADFTFITCLEEMNEQFICVAEKVIPKLIDKNIPLKEIVIVTGSNDEATELASILKKNSIPCYVVRWKFDQQSDIVQWLFDCARWCNNLNNSFQQLYWFWNKLITIHNDSRRRWDDMKRLMEFHQILLSVKKEKELKNWIHLLFDSLRLLEVLEDSERYPDELENLEKLINEIEDGSLKNLTLKNFIELSQPEKEVTVITRHSVKGLEFEAVIMLGMEEGRFPYYTYKNNSREMKEAHRLCYVCVSRARKICILLRSQFITLFPKDRPPRRKAFGASRFWTSLYKIFGGPENTHSSIDY
jgi:superfamily I DNA/RNA helicase